MSGSLSKSSHLTHSPGRVEHISMQGCSGKGEPVVTGPSAESPQPPLPFPASPPPHTPDLTMPIAGKALAMVCPDPQMSHSPERVKLKLAWSQVRRVLGLRKPLSPWQTGGLVPKGTGCWRRRGSVPRVANW